MKASYFTRLKEAKVLWEALGNVPINDNDEIDVDWNIFPKGTNRFSIWQWIESTYDISVVKDLLFNEHTF